MSAAGAGGAAGEAGRDIWSIALSDRANKKKGLEETKTGEDGTPAPSVTETVEGSESFVLFVGAKQSGKSGVIVQFLNPNKDDSPKPTVALEYTFGRRSNTASTVKDIAHIWELGGGTHLKDLVNVPITPQRLPTSVVVVVVDLSKPAESIDRLCEWLELIKTRVVECCDKIKKSKPEELATLMEKAADRVRHSSHPDAAMITPSVMPLIICCNKYDVFQDFESSQRKVLLQALRYIALAKGASLLCTSQRDKAQMSHFRMLLNHYVFRTDAKKAVQLNPAKPLMIPAGQDNIESIGLPPGASRSDLEVGSFQSRVARFKRAVDEAFPRSAGASSEESKTDEDESAAWVEGAVDAMRAQKLEEVERYKKEAERKLRMEAKGASRSKSKRRS